MIMGINKKYIKPTAVLSMVLLVLLFLPFLKVENEALTFWSIATSSYFDGLIRIALLLMAVCPVILTVLSVWDLFRLSKGKAKLHIIISVIYCFLITSSLLIMKKTIDGAEIFSAKFMISDLKMGYWLALLISYANLHVSMKACKIHPGYIALVLMSIVWLFPVFYLLMSAVRTNGGFYVSSIIPEKIGLQNYIKVITDTSKFHYLNWYKNTLFVAVCSCILTTFIVLSTAYVISRIKFVRRKLLMNLLLVLGMFPGFMSMIAVYYILKGMGLEQSLAALIIVYSAGASLGYYVAKGFFDTIPRALDEAAYIDGATKWDVFTKVTIPLSKPIIIYTVLTSFMGPWADYIFASVILGDKTKYYTVAIGLFQMISRDNIEKYFTQFAAGATLIALPIAILFISLQKYYVEGLSGSVKG